MKEFLTFDTADLTLACFLLVSLLSLCVHLKVPTHNIRKTGLLNHHKVIMLFKNPHSYQVS